MVIEGGRFWPNFMEQEVCQTFSLMGSCSFLTVSVLSFWKWLLLRSQSPGHF
jgi:hypothetical protein